MKQFISQEEVVTFSQKLMFSQHYAFYNHSKIWICWLMHRT